jgi:hypothetical protein
MKSLIKVIVSIMLCSLLITACAGSAKNESESGASSEATSVSKEESKKEEATESKTTGEVNKKACFITNMTLGNDFTDLIWAGIKKLESEGWTVKCIEMTESGEFADQIRAMAAEGYDVMFTFADDVSNVAVELAPELAQNYPNLHVFLLDTYMEQDQPNCTSIAVDTFESSFIAGYVAAANTSVKKVGWIGHTDMFKITRFRDGYIAGIQYYNKKHNDNVEYVSAFTGDWNDPVKGYETAISMIDTYGVDIIYQCNYNGGPGVIQACAEKGIKCIGVDDYQGDIDPCVFWSAIKSMDVATYTLASTYQKGTEYGAFQSFDIKSGAKVYDERDEKNISPETLEEVKEIMSQITAGTIDIYEGFDDYRP